MLATWVGARVACGGPPAPLRLPTLFVRNPTDRRRCWRAIACSAWHLHGLAVSLAGQGRISAPEREGAVARRSEATGQRLALDIS
jgi:hypothetical protein